MKIPILILLPLFFLSCHSGQARKEDPRSVKTADSISKQILLINKQEIIVPPDSSSTDYLIYLLQNEKPLIPYWMQKVDTMDGFFFMPEDSSFHLSLIKHWRVNDSISVVIMSSSGGTSYDEFLVTFKNKHDWMGNIHISDNDDSDLSPENPYYYTKYKLLNDRKVKLFNHKITGEEGGDENDKLISIETWTIQSNGRIVKG